MGAERTQKLVKILLSFKTIFLLLNLLHLDLLCGTSFQMKKMKKIEKKKSLKRSKKVFLTTFGCLQNLKASWNTQQFLIMIIYCLLNTLWYVLINICFIGLILVLFKKHIYPVLYNMVEAKKPLWDLKNWPVDIYQFWCCHTARLRAKPVKQWSFTKGVSDWSENIKNCLQLIQDYFN